MPADDHRRNLVRSIYLLIDEAHLQNHAQCVMMKSCSTLVIGVNARCTLKLVKSIHSNNFGAIAMM